MLYIFYDWLDNRIWQISAARSARTHMHQDKYVTFPEIALADDYYSQVHTTHQKQDAQHHTSFRSQLQCHPQI